MKLSIAQKTALRELSAAGGEGCIDKFGAVVAAGERLKFDPATWLRLFTLGHIEAAGPLRIRITASGKGLIA
jgi:hypothetical protein